jgi:hypothetical protein|nr:MAG TPA: zinc ribbon domain protein [Caudoviricetes sp.]
MEEKKCANCGKFTDPEDRATLKNLEKRRIV